MTAALTKPAIRTLDHKAVVSNVGPVREGRHWVTLETRRHGTILASIAATEKATLAQLRRAHANCSCHEIMVAYQGDIFTAGEIILVHA